MVRLGLAAFERHAVPSPSSQASSKHTILLTQTTQQNNSRTFRDFDSPTAALNSTLPGEGLAASCCTCHLPPTLCIADVIKMYEGRLRELNPGVSNISYDISDLFAYIDSLPDMAAMV